ncbi:hypothetical protein GGD64_008096 [Bradyrhizobium sp. CIR3A]|nr:hypothetical protein [Bradyrhizobium sp. CIR3A]
MSRSGNVWDNAAVESFFSSLKTERTANKIYRTRDEARADVFDYIERFYNTIRRHSTIGYLSPVEFERRARYALRRGRCSTLLSRAFDQCADGGAAKAQNQVSLQCPGTARSAASG